MSPGQRADTRGHLGCVRVAQAWPQGTGGGGLSAGRGHGAPRVKPEQEARQVQGQRLDWASGGRPNRTPEPIGRP